MKSLPGHSSLQDWVPVPSAVLQTAPLLAGVLALLVLVLSRLPDPSSAAHESVQLDHEVHVSHWQSTVNTHFSHTVNIFQCIKRVTRAFFSARLSSSSISCIASNSIIGWGICCACPCSFLITRPIHCSTGVGAAWPWSPCFPLTIHWKNLSQSYCYHVSIYNNVTWTFFSARLSSRSISCIANRSIISWCVCCACPCSFLITGPILCSTGVSAAWPWCPSLPLTIHWKNLCQSHGYIVSIYKNFTRTFFSARLSSRSISCIASNSIISWCVCCACPCSFLIPGPIHCSTGVSAAWPWSPRLPLAIHWKNLCQSYCYNVSIYKCYQDILQCMIEFQFHQPSCKQLHY